MNKNNKKISIEYVDISILKPSEYNPRTWDKNQEEKLTESIKKFDLIDPLIINSAPGRENIIIGGHFRYKIAKDLGFSKIPVIYICITDREKEKELNLRLNKNQGSWNIKLLEDFDISLLLDIGFSDDELSEIWDRNLEIEDDGFDVEKELESIKKVTTKPGDIFKCGNHVVGCGDALDFNFLDMLIGDSMVDMVFTDPPYNINLDYHNGIGTNGKYGGHTKDNKSEDEYKNFLSRAIENALRKAKKDCHIFFFCDESNIGLLQQLYKEHGISNKRVCLWIKNNANPTPQVAFNKMYEPCVYGTLGAPYLSKSVTNLNEILNKEVSTGNRAIDDILDLLNIWIVKRLPTSSYEHPTQKPVSLVEKPLRRCTRPGDAVLDLFGGSGSTLVACEEMHRRCVMLELEPIFVDLIKRRWEKLTGMEAIRVNKTG
jgi:DNA modification methylase